MFSDPFQLSMTKTCNEKIFKRYNIKDKNESNEQTADDAPTASVSLSQIIQDSWTGSRIYKLLPDGSAITTLYKERGNFNSLQE